MKYLIILLLVLSSCAAHHTGREPTLAEKQEYYHENIKHQMEEKDKQNIIFWAPIIFIMSFMYVYRINNK